MHDVPPPADAELRLDLLPALPQSQTVRDLAPRLWRDERVLAVWLGGSFATGTADPYSDIDLRVAVPPEDLVRWETPDLDALLGAPPLARHMLRLGEDSFLHHLILTNGDIMDLLIHSAARAPGIEPTLVLGCRDEAFAHLLAASSHAPAPVNAPVTGDLVRSLVVELWVNSHKHRKVLYRRLDLMFPAATYFNWQMLMRLWYIAATGSDASREHFTGIHGLTELTRAVEGTYGAEPLAVCGAPTRDREEICTAIERYQDVISQLGRMLAERYSFAYPAELEAVTRQDWWSFLAVTGRTTSHSEPPSAGYTEPSDGESAPIPTQE
ncbi:MAG: nucleotidyltransferase family protein [Ktedonobacterales bacterium]